MFQRDVLGVPRAPQALRWSGDGKIAVCVDGGVAILSPVGALAPAPVAAPLRSVPASNVCGRTEPYMIHFTGGRRGWEEVRR